MKFHCSGDKYIIGITLRFVTITTLNRINIVQMFCLDTDFDQTQSF